jgi:hypothetical protein
MSDLEHGENFLYIKRDEAKQLKRLEAALGWTIKVTAQWAPWDRLRSIYGWPRLLRAVEACEPGQRFPSDAEKLCLQYQRDSEQEAREAKAREVRDTPVQRSPDEVRYEIWSKHYGIEPWPRWLRELAKKLGKEEA